jgi:hypothetical protein
LKMSLHSMLQILSVTPFQKIPLLQILAEELGTPKTDDSATQLILL